MFWKFAVRDLVILAVCLGCWQLEAALRAPGWQLLPILAAVLAAVVTTLVGLLFHEWGHLAGAAFLHSAVGSPRKLVTPFLFYFDTERNNGRQFVGMSLGGFLASGVFVLLLLALLPLHSLAGKLTLLFVIIGVVATLILEVPAAWRVAHGAAVPPGPKAV